MCLFGCRAAKNAKLDAMKKESDSVKAWPEEESDLVKAWLKQYEARLMHQAPENPQEEANATNSDSGKTKPEELRVRLMYVQEELPQTEADAMGSCSGNAAAEELRIELMDMLNKVPQADASATKPGSESAEPSKVKLFLRIVERPEKNLEEAVLELLTFFELLASAIMWGILLATWVGISRALPEWARPRLSG